MKSNGVMNHELRDLNHEKAFEYYLGYLFKNNSPRPKVNVSNPLLKKKQATPSFNYFQTDSGEWRFNDFATGDKGDIIELVRNLFSLEFKDAIEKIKSDLGINNDMNEKIIIKTKWNQQYVNYWLNYNISMETLEKYSVYPVETIKNKQGTSEEYTTNYKPEDPIFAYQISNNCDKIYRPLSKFKFSWIGNKPAEYIFGINQLPQFSEVIYIAAGEKDVLSLASIGQSAVCFNSETSNPSVDSIQKLKQRANKVIVLYDADETGIKHSEKLAKQFNLSVLHIPKEVLLEGEKDISDVLSRGIDFKLFCDNATDFHQVESILSADESLIVQKMMSTRKKLSDRMKEKIIMPSPLIKLNDLGVIYPRTINIIQGKAGVHKSRLAEILCACLITTDPNQDGFLTFKRNPFIHPTVLYVDTERNLTHQYPYALQQIKKNAGFEVQTEVECFDFISILEISRDKRFKAIDVYLKKKRAEIQGPLVVILDVITDCIKDFNRSEDSMELIDLLNTAINHHDVTFITLIHENPGVGEKARGHLGTELMNKASTVIQIGFELDGSNKATDLIALKFLKTRASQKPDTTHIRFCQERKTLVLATDDDISNVYQARKKKAKAADIIDYLESDENYKEKYIASELHKDIAEWFSCNVKTSTERVNEIVSKGFTIKSKSGVAMFMKKTKEGKSIVYNLVNAD